MAYAYAAPIMIASCAQLKGISPHSQAHYQLSNNIECKGVEFFPIGPFSGTLEGNGYTIANLTVQKNTEPNAGLFTTLGSATVTAMIKNIHFVNAKVIGADDTHRGLIAGGAYNADISNITVDKLKIESGGDKPRSAASGGLLGVAENTTLFNIHLFNGIHINKNQYAGGLIGIAKENTVIEQSTVIKLSSGGFDCGSGKTCAFGGLIGFVDNNSAEEKVTINQSSATGEIYTKKNAGGLIGLVQATASLDISNSYAIVTVSNKCNSDGGCLAKYAGGLIGRAENNDVGVSGIINLQYVYAAGEIAVFSETGGKGVVGGDHNSPATRVIAYESYFDTEATAHHHSGDRGSIGLNTKQMHNADYFQGWNSAIWTIRSGQYPRLIHTQP